MSFQQIGGFYCLLFGAGLIAGEGECDPLAWQGPDTVNIDLNAELQWLGPDIVNINLCAPLQG